MNELLAYDVWSDRYELLYRCRFSRIYYQKRERFFEFCERLSTGLALVASMVNIWLIFGSNDFARCLSLIIIILLFILGIHCTNKAHTHAGFVNVFRDIEADIDAAVILTGEKVDRFLAKILRVKLREPRTLGALVRICQNEIALARGNKQDIRPVPFFKKLFAHFYDWKLAP